jgi:hypothetical protein
MEVTRTFWRFGSGRRRQCMKVHGSWNSLLHVPATDRRVANRATASGVRLVLMLTVSSRMPAFAAFPLKQMHDAREER